MFLAWCESNGLLASFGVELSWAFCLAQADQFLPDKGCRRRASIATSSKAHLQAKQPGAKEMFIIITSGRSILPLRLPCMLGPAFL